MGVLRRKEEERQRAAGRPLGDFCERAAAQKSFFILAKSSLLGAVILSEGEVEVLFVSRVLPSRSRRTCLLLTEDDRNGFKSLQEKPARRAFAAKLCGLT